MKPSGYNYAFCVPRYGAEIAGGAEALVRELAQALAFQGHSVDVLTTCAKDNRTWQNEYLAGTEVIDGVTVRRFKVDERNLDKWLAVELQIHEGRRPPIDKQIEWMEESVNSLQLYEYIFQNAGNYKAIFFAPYLFGTTFWGSQIAPKKSVLIPCLHDENYAYLEIMNVMFHKVRGCIFNSSAEKDLASRLFGDLKGGEVGMGFKLSAHKNEFSPYFSDMFPYLLYFGRKETGKNLHLLVDYFVSLKESGFCPELKLVIAGGGDITDIGREDAVQREDIIDLGFLSESEKQRLIRHSLAVCQPSVNESFSIVLMEAWELERPVIVHARCPVTREHVLESGGGLYFSSPEDFAGIIERMLKDRELCLQMGQCGRLYVERKYNRDSVMKRFENTLRVIFGDGSES
ncbi:MAG: glycosyltransferase [Candidatus Dadabacteria bacterium]|nr:MAG: glycosyltransferase [Candidatus Dadabacteria bacterium]